MAITAMNATEDVVFIAFLISFYYCVSVLVVYCGAPVLRMTGAIANDMI